MSNPSFTNIAVVGMHFRELEGVPAKAYVSSFMPPLELQFEREPDNAYDEYAIKVLHRGEHIGYIESKAACFISPVLDEGVTYRLICVDLEERRNNLHPICDMTPVEYA